MKYAVVSDIHANLEAFTAVLRAIDRLGVDAIVCLGDIVGYNANPNECIALLRSSGALCIAGNHDRAAIGTKDVLRFSARARRAIHWTRSVIGDDSLDFLLALPLSRRIVPDDPSSSNSNSSNSSSNSNSSSSSSSSSGFEAFFCVHGALHPDPNDDIHLTTFSRIESSLKQLTTGRFGARLCFFGHTHLAIVHARSPSGGYSSVTARQLLSSNGHHYLVNPGSVGEPRSSDGRARFLTFDSTTGALEFQWAPYDAQTCMAKVERAGLLYEPTMASRSADWLFDKIDSGRSAARRLTRALR